MLQHLFFTLLSVWCLLVHTQAALIIPQGRIPLRAYGLNQNYVSEYRFTANIPTNVYTDAWIELLFPEDFVLSSDCLAYIRTQSSNPAFEPFPCSKTLPTTYRIDIGTIVSGIHEIYLQGVRNPLGRYGSGSFKIRTHTGTILIDENDFFGDAPLLEPAGKLRQELLCLAFSSVLDHLYYLLLLPITVLLWITVSKAFFLFASSKFCERNRKHHGIHSS